MNINKGFSLSARILRMADGDSGGGDAAAAAAAAQGSSATTGADGKTVGDAANANQQANSAAASVPFGTSADTVAPDWRKDLGDFANDPSLKDFKTPADLAKSFIETKKMVGQKNNGIPGKDATPEQVAEYHKAIGVPDAAEGYEFKKPDNLPPAMAEAYSEEDALAWAKQMKELGVPKETANALRNKFIEQQVKAIGDAKEAVEYTDADFDKVFEKHFGADKFKAVIQTERAAVEKVIPPDMKPVIATLNNHQLAAFAAYGQGIRAELGGEDQTAGDDGGEGSASSEAQLRGELREIMSKPEYSNPFAKGKEAHLQEVEKAKKISAQIAALKAGKK